MSIEIQQPQPYDIVGATVQLAGTGGGAFEASYGYRITEGHDEVTGHFMAGDGTGGHGQFQMAADVSGAAFTQVVALVEVFHVSARDGSEPDRQVVPVIRGLRTVPGYTTHLEHVVQPGESLWAIAHRHYGNGNLYHRLVAANPSITNPKLIHAGDVLRVPRAG